MNHHGNFDRRILVEYLLQVSQFLRQYSINPIPLHEVMPETCHDDDSMFVLSASSDEGDDLEVFEASRFSDLDEIDRSSRESVIEEPQEPSFGSRGFGMTGAVHVFEDDGTVEIPGLSFIPLGVRKKALQ